MSPLDLELVCITKETKTRYSYSVSGKYHCQRTRIIPHQFILRCGKLSIHNVKTAHSPGSRCSCRRFARCLPDVKEWTTRPRTRHPQYRNRFQVSGGSDPNTWEGKPIGSDKYEREWLKVLTLNGLEETIPGDRLGYDPKGGTVRVRSNIQTHPLLTPPSTAQKTHRSPEHIYCRFPLSPWDNTQPNTREFSSRLKQLFQNNVVTVWAKTCPIDRDRCTVTVLTHQHSLWCTGRSINGGWERSCLNSWGRDPVLFVRNVKICWLYLPFLITGVLMR